MARDSANYPHSFNVQVSNAQYERLQQMAAKESTDMAPILRRAIDARYQHTILQVAHCSDSQRCRCPQFFAPPQTPQTPTHIDPATS